MKIKNMKYMLVCLVLLFFVIGAASASDIDDASINQEDAAAIDSVSEDTATVSGSQALESDLQGNEPNAVKQEDSSVKTVLSDGESINIYVSNEGNDSNSGFTQSDALATISKAMSLVKNGAGTEFNVFVANGDYNIEEINAPAGKNVNLLGESREGVTVHILGYFGIDVYSSNETWRIENFTFCDMNSSFSTSAAIKCTSQNSDFTINNCIFRNIGSRYGAIQISQTGTRHISNVLIENCYGTSSSTNSIIYISGQNQIVMDNIEIRGSYAVSTLFDNGRYLEALILADQLGPNATLMNSRILDNNGSISSIIEFKGKISVINTTISNNYLNTSQNGFYGGEHILYTGTDYNSESNINITQSVISNNVLAGRVNGLFDITYGSHSIDSSIILKNVYANGSDVEFAKLAGGISISCDDNYWGTDIKPNDFTDRWVILSGDVLPPFVGVPVRMNFYLEYYLSTSGAMGDVEGMPYFEFSLSYLLNPNNPSTLAFVDGKGSIEYTAENGGNESINLSDIDFVNFTVRSDTDSLIYVDGSVESSGNGSFERPLKTIGEALSIAGDDYVIIIRNGTYHEKNLIIDKNLTIMADDDAEVIIDAEGEGRIFNISSQVMIQNLILKGGNEEFGGAICIDDGDLMIYDVTITDSSAVYGGAIAVGPTSTLVITSSVLNSNNASFGGALYSEGPLFISRSKFNDNYVNNENGDAYGGSVYLNTTTVGYFTSNTFNGGKGNKGDVIYVNDGNLTMVGNHITDGIIYIEGGCVNSALVFMDGHTVTLQPGDTVNLTASLSDDEGNLIRGGSLIFTANGETVQTVDLTADNELNVPYTVPGDATDNIIISGSYSFGEEGTVTDGAIHPAVPKWFIEGGSGYEFLSEAVSDAVSGDVIYGVAGTYTVNNITVSKDITIRADERGTVILDGDKLRMFTVTDSATLTLVNLDLMNGGNAGGGFIFIPVSGGNINIVNTTMRDLNSSSEGGAINVFASFSTVNIEGCLFENINSTAPASVFSSYYADNRHVITVRDSTFSNIKCSDSYALMKAIGKLVIERSNFTDIAGNISRWQGAIGSAVASDYFINECRFINITGGYGSSLYIGRNFNATITKSVFMNNRNTQGTINLDSPARVNINYNIFIGNECTSGDSRDIRGAQNLNASYNFWGSNEQPTREQISLPSTALYWTVVELSSDRDPVYEGTTAQITVKFVATDGENTFDLSDSMPEFDLELTVTDGEISPSTVTLSDNSANAVFTPPFIVGTVTLMAFPSEAELEINVMDTSRLLVVSTDGSNDNPGTLESPYATIEYALTQLNGNRNIIYLLNSTESYKEKGLSLSGNLTIMGADSGVTVDGENGGPIFNVNGNVTVKDLRLINGLTDSYGGAVYLEGGRLTLYNVVISNSTAFCGGAIATASDSNLLIHDSTFNDNKATCGGALYIGQDALVLNSDFNRNSANNSYGGAIYLNTTDLITISSNNFRENRADKGEAVYVENGELVLAKNEMDDDESVYMSNGLVNSILTFLDNSTIKAEPGETVNLTASLCDDCGNRIRGGTVTFTADGETVGIVDLSDGDEMVISYTVPLDAGGDIVISGNYSLADSEEVSNGKIHPAIPCWFIEGGKGYEFLDEAIENTQDGDVIYGLPGVYTVNGILITNDITIMANESGSIVLDGNRSRIFTTAADLDLINMVLVNGGINGGGFVTVGGSTTLTLVNSTLRDLNSTGSGGAISLSSGADLYIEASRFENITSTAAASVILSSGTDSNIDIRDSVFDSIKCSYDYTVMEISGNLTLQNSNFTNIDGKNNSGWYGALGFISSANASISECRFINITGGDGSAIYFSSKGDLRVNKSVFENIKSAKGAIYLNNQHSATINHNIFIDNTPSGSNARDIYKNSGNLDANYNFWGNNSRPTTAQISSPDDAAIWNLLNMATYADPVYIGTGADIFILYLLSNNEAYPEYDISMPEYSFNLEATGGSIPSTVNHNGSYAIIRYTPPSEEGAVTITANPGSVELVLDIRNASELIVVSTDGDNENGAGTLDSPYKTIAFALTQISDTRNVIYLLNRGESYKESGLILSGNVTIKSDDLEVTVDGQNRGRIFTVTGNATLRNFIIMGANTSLGGAVYVDGGSLTLSEMEFRECSADLGGAIYLNTSSDVIINSSVFTDLEAEKGEAVYVENANLILNDNLMFEAAVYLEGGSVNSYLRFLDNGTINVEYGKTVTLSAELNDEIGNIIRGGSVTFTANGETIGTVDLSGDNPLEINYTVPSDADGDIVISGSYSFENGGKVYTGIIHPCVFYWFTEDGKGYEKLEDAVADAIDGDVIYGIAGNYTVSGLKIEKSIVIMANESGSVILDGNGSGIFDVSSDLTLINMTLVNGGTTGKAGLINSSASLYIYDTVFKDTVMTTSSTRGGAIYSSGSIYIYDSVFENLKSREGAAIYQTASNGILVIEDTVFDGINSTYDGGVIRSNVETVIVKSNFTNIIGAATPGDYGNIFVTGDHLHIEESNFINISGPKGAAVYYVHSGGTLNITDSVFENINCTNQGIIYSTAESYINYNVFLNVNEGVNITSANLGNGNIDFNYWGTNENPSTIISTYSPNNWIIMNVVLNDSEVYVDKDVKVIADFDHYIENGVVEVLDYSLEKEFTVSFLSDTGIFSPDEVNTTYQMAVSLYTAVSGENNITVKSDNAVVQLSFNASEALDDRMSVAIDNNNNLIVTITDEDGNGLAERMVSLYINDEILYGFTDNDGKALISLDTLEGGAYSAYIVFKDPVYKDINESTFVIVMTDYVPVVVNITIKLSFEDDMVIANVTDLDGNPLAGKFLSVNLNGNPVLGAKTDENGIYSIDISGNSTVVVTCFDALGAKTTASIEVIKSTKELTDLIEELNETVNNQSEVISTLNETVNTQAGVISELNDTVNTQAGVISNLNETVNTQAGVISNLNETVNNQSAVIGELNDIVNNQSEVISGLNDTVNTQAGVISNLNETVNNQSAVIGELNDTVNSQSEVISTLNDTVNNQTALIGELNDTVNSQSGLIADLNDTVNNQSSLIDNLLKTVNAQNNLINGLNEAVANQTAIINSQAAMIESLYQTIADLNSTINNLTEIISTLNKTRAATVLVADNLTTFAYDSSIDGNIGDNFTATLTDANGNPLAYKDVQIGLNGKIYNRTTDANGKIYVLMKTKIAGRYTFAVSFLGDDDYNASFTAVLGTVNKQTPKLTTSNKSYKASAKTKTLSATFKTASGNPVSGKKITFTVNGKTYSATTNSKGVASVNVSLSKKGSYSFTVKYAGDSTYAAVSKKATLKIT